MIVAWIKERQRRIRVIGAYPDTSLALFNPGYDFYELVRATILCGMEKYF